MAASIIKTSPQVRIFLLHSEQGCQLKSHRQRKADVSFHSPAFHYEIALAGNSKSKEIKFLSSLDILTKNTETREKYP